MNQQDLTKGHVMKTMSVFAANDLWKLVAAGLQHRGYLGRQLPDPAGADPHPRLLLEGRGIHAGEGFTALFPDGWHDITLEVRWDPTGLGYWYISTPGFKDVCPVGLFVKCK